jgi:hypothetical protein
VRLTFELRSRRLLRNRGNPVNATSKIYRPGLSIPRQRASCGPPGSQDFYLGKHGTPESYARYYALLAEYNANGKQAPSKPHEESERLADTDIPVKHVTADFRQPVLPRYASNYGQHNRYQNLLALLEQKHGNDSVDSFGPRKLEALRAGFVSRGIGDKETGGVCRTYANTLTRLVVKIIQHACQFEAIPALAEPRNPAETRGFFGHRCLLAVA